MAKTDLGRRSTGRITPTATKSGLEGRLLDCDAHLYMEPEVMAEIVGPVGGGFVLDFLRGYHGSPEDMAARAQNREDVWGVKGISALGALDPADRLTAMDMTGIRAQLLFPNTALMELRGEGQAARDACRRYNDYAVDWTRRAAGRARAVCQINMSDVDLAIAELDRVLAMGAQGILMGCAQPPAGVSPANTLWDPFWARLEAAGVPALLHIGSGGVMTTTAEDPMLPPRGFANADTLRKAFEGRPGGEEAIGPYYVLVCHMAPEVWVMTMVMGGVFERFPRLALGIIEVGASWVGPMCERMDAHADLMAKVGFTFSMKPSEFVRRNVRVTPFWSEDLCTMVDRYGLSEVYVFNSDFPHIEGSRDPVGKFRKWTDRMDPAYEPQFYCENAELLFPGLQ
ncbi:Predicted metal-dependent hydrolase, TIM-barrel fold [Sphingomonas laterariae]|uniref:Predicted metal-dependent hydrolase, TIM-barrel fold n=1 Tax=Edaphosphingomonas laterariae TaxID=861865 RepID=A0A239C9C2_9SPHN|nr:amidohydrolase family protein [Sphingomonas laterariae]SNS15963.1 Predicted metal-dependent hydrolase, TIM-barrel fold [Sphingomonas laterariae]